jgi:hypothetical protein
MYQFCGRSDPACGIASDIPTNANTLGMDWRFLAAIGYQESHWDPLASRTGVRG